MGPPLTALLDYTDTKQGGADKPHRPRNLRGKLCIRALKKMTQDYEQGTRGETI